MSQGIGWIYEQFWPLGQQMAELPLSKLMHVADEGQQKLDGSLDPGHCWYDFGHELESLGPGFKACVWVAVVDQVVMRTCVAGFSSRI